MVILARGEIVEHHIINHRETHTQSHHNQSRPTNEQIALIHRTIINTR